MIRRGPRLAALLCAALTTSMAIASTPADEAGREQGELRDAQTLARQSRFAEALQRADRLAREAQSSEIRLRAAALAVNVQTASRDFLDGQKRLDALLAAVEHQPDSAARRQVDLVAAIFYNQLSQPDVALRHAERVLAGDADPTVRCNATVQAIEARLAGASQGLTAADFDIADALCATATQALPPRYVDVLRAQWWIAKGEAERAVAHLQPRMRALQATGYTPLVAEAHAAFAEALQKTGQLDEAQSHTDAVLALSAGLPSGLPLLSARRTRYAIALARGDDRTALSELQAVLTAERAYEDEVRHLLATAEAGRAASMARQQATALLEQRNAQLAVEARHSERMARWFTLLLVPLGIAVVALLGWTWHSRRLRQRHRKRLQVDPLTTVWTRQHFSEQATAALAKAERDAQPMALLLFDLDHFSEVNSRHGHLSGDRLLAAVGHTLARLQGPGRQVGRLGGEEFAMLLTGAGLDEGLEVAEHCRNAIAATRANTFDGSVPLSITASFGVVSTTAAGYRLRDLLANADHALYRAKAAGRNRVAAAAVAAPDDAETPA